MLIKLTDLSEENNINEQQSPQADWLLLGLGTLTTGRPRIYL